MRLKKDLEDVKKKTELQDIHILVLAKMESGVWVWKGEKDETQPPTVVSKLEAQFLTYVRYIEHMFLHVWRRLLYAKSVLINKISASELS